MTWLDYSHRTLFDTRASENRWLNPASFQTSFKPTFTAMAGAQGPTVILGGGIIGLSTAYHLALALRDQNTPILVADPSSAICSGASGQCEGALGGFGFDKQVQPLGKLRTDYIPSWPRGREPFLIMHFRASDTRISSSTPSSTNMIPPILGFRIPSQVRPLSDAMI